MFLGRTAHTPYGVDRCPAESVLPRIPAEQERQLMLKFPTTRSQKSSREA